MSHDSANVNKIRNCCLGIFVHRPRWGLSWRGRLVALCLAFSLLALLIKGIHPFLALNKEVSAKILVVEGWVSSPARLFAITKFYEGGYERMYVVGSPVKAAQLTQHASDTYASVAAEELVRFGFPQSLFESVPTTQLPRNRTFGCASTLRDWFKSKGLKVSSLNIVTEGPHARRTRLLYQEAFGPDVKVGIISVTNPEYDPRTWWRYSEGMKEVMSETGAYLYTKLFFRP